MYAMVDDVLYVSTRRPSRKARNITTNPRVFVCIPVRRLPVGPPSSVQFAATGWECRCGACSVTPSMPPE